MATSAAPEPAAHPARVMFVGGSVPALAAGLVVVAVSAGSGRSALLGAAGGWLLVVLALAVVPAVHAAVRGWPDAVLPGVAVLTHVLVVTVVGLGGWWLTGRSWVHDGWFVGAAAATILAWVLGAGRAALRARVPVYDPQPARDTERDRPERRNGPRV